MSTSKHKSYPFDIIEIPEALAEQLLPPNAPVKPGKNIDNRQDLNILYYNPFIPKLCTRQLFEFLRTELPFYRVEYTIKRGGIETKVQTPRLVFYRPQKQEMQNKHANFIDGQLSSASMRHRDSRTGALSTPNLKYWYRTDCMTVILRDQFHNALIHCGDRLRLRLDSSSISASSTTMPLGPTAYPITATTKSSLAPSQQ